jgi:hypothetical protein
MAGDISQSKTISDLLEAIKATYGVDVPAIGSDLPLPMLWQKSITVTEGVSPAPLYTATASISDAFPFNFAATLPNPEFNVNLKIDVFETVPKSQATRGIKVTVFPVKKSSEHPNGVIVKRGLSFVDKKGNPVEDSSSDRIPAESVVPPEAVV